MRFLFLLTAITLHAQQLKLTEEKVYGREAWVLTNGQNPDFVLILGLPG